MTIKLMRRTVFILILAVICAGAVFQYRTADFKSNRLNAVLVMAHAE